MEHEATSSATLEVITHDPVELIRSDSQEYFRGLASVFYDGHPSTEYRMGNVRERIDRQAFTDVLKEAEDIEARYNHDPNHVLGSTKTGTLFLEITPRGLAYSIPFDPTDSDHTKVRAKLRKGIATGSSFQFRSQTKMAKDGSGYIRTVVKVTDLVEISIVNKPAYKGASAELRSAIDEFERTQRILERIKAM